MSRFNLKYFDHKNVSKTIRKRTVHCILFIVILFAACNSCSNQSSVNNKPAPIVFFVAGHTYGYRWVDNIGLHPQFQEKFDLINDRKADFGVLLGDIVFECTEEDWAEVDSVLQFLNCTTYFAVGNHDMVDRKLFESRYGKTYFSFEYQQDLFIVLDPNLDNWNISGEQLLFLKDVVKDTSNINRNVFIFFHQLLWWSNDNKYKKVKANSMAKRDSSNNFWSEIEPLFRNLHNPVYMFAGDLGAGNWTEDFMYDTYDNITFIATGMGSDEGDNFVIVSVNENGKVSFELISLFDKDIQALGKLEDYILP